MNESNPPDDSSLSTDDVYEVMEPLEPYTTGELAKRLRASKGLVWSLLNKLVGEDKVRKKEPEPNLRIWIRESPAYECPDCGYEFQIKVLHPVLTSVRRCPRCGTQIRS
jgi:predicted Zn-ribbon and HTH transcriptional regulator